MTISPAFGCGTGISRHSRTALCSWVTIQQVFMIGKGFRGYREAIMLPVSSAAAISGGEAARVTAFNTCHDMAQLRNPLGRRNVSGGRSITGYDLSNGRC